MNQAKKSDMAATMLAMGHLARAASKALAHLGADQKSAALHAAADAIRAAAPQILAANVTDMQGARMRGLASARLDRLMLDEARIEAMASGVDEVADLPDPIGEVDQNWTPANGLNISRVRTPLGVIGMIYESRPNVTADAGAICVKAGNAVILRGGADGFFSSMAIAKAFRAGLAARDVPENAVQLVPDTDRAAVGAMLGGLDGTIDLIIPRGGKSLIARVQAEARVPVLSHLEGLCHVYVHKDADADMARAIALNAKMRRTGVCGSAETLLIDRDCAKDLLPLIAKDLSAAGCELRGDEAARALAPAMKAATEEDWATEYLDAILSVRVVDGLDAAMAHIAKYGSAHTDSIVTNDAEAATRFLNGVDSAIVLHNASTQYADGGEFGFGAEIGIATGKLHARGPVGAAQLTSYHYVVRGHGHIRP
ncbi:MAG: glutamate-5-semialdehyde dehydrogenase [Robiginitomaculum sp.]|nr:MAG: glutamate-5-semialdehyde dehydrogenase [Robiginitomaculum sp.]